MVAGMSKDFGDESVTAAGASALGCGTLGLCTGGVAAVLVETGLAGAPSTVTASTGAAEAVVAAGMAATTGVTATTAAVVAAAEALVAEEEEAEARFFFFPASFFNAASAMAWGNFGGGFWPANPAAT